jgi:hypothetical protein
MMDRIKVQVDMKAIDAWVGESQNKSKKVYLLITFSSPIQPKLSSDNDNGLRER